MIAGKFHSPPMPVPRENTEGLEPVQERAISSMRRARCVAAGPLRGGQAQTSSTQGLGLRQVKGEEGWVTYEDEVQDKYIGRCRTAA